MLWSATLATIIGAILIPTFQRLFSRAVFHFQVNRSIPRLLLRIFFKGGLAQLKDVASLLAAGNITQMRATNGISPWVIALNVAAIALWTTGVFASLYAGYLYPALRVTSSSRLRADGCKLRATFQVVGFGGQLTAAGSFALMMYPFACFTIFR